ncbi:MAG TPA: C1 family peptidase [Syntrophomonas sp.]|nr:C1 family peptidase [Syntrophomonas sp.]
MSFEIVYQLRRYLEKLPQTHYGRRLDYIPSAYDSRDYRYGNLIGAISGEKLEPIDYRSQLPPVFDQEDRGTCVACASAWTVKAYEEMEQKDYPDGGLSVSFLYSMCKENDGMPCLEGTQPKVSMQVLRKYGICPTTVMPYDDLTDLPSPQVPNITVQALETATNYKIKTYAQLCSTSDQNRPGLINVMRAALKKEGPFLLALLVCENFKPDTNYELPLPAGNMLGGHAVGIAGDLPDRECLILRNSWGSEWGENGYAYLPYAWLEDKVNGSWAVSEAWTATDMVPAQAAKKIVITPGIKTVKVDGNKAAMSDTVFFTKSSPYQAAIADLAEKMGYRLDWEGGKAVFTRFI